MSYLGYMNPLRRLSGTLLGWLNPPRPVHQTPDIFYIIGHRGAPQSAPENTISSFATAIELGANAVETDVCVTRDGHFILWHDANPDGSVAQIRPLIDVGLYIACIPALGSPWRQPVDELDLSTLQTHYGYIHRAHGTMALLQESAQPEVAITVLEDLIAWVRLEQRVRHVFLDLKLTPEQSDTAVSLLDLLRRLCTREGFRDDVVFCLLSTQTEIVEALVREAQRAALPPTIQLYGDFELPGVLALAPRLGIRHASMGCTRRIWGDFRREVSQVLAARDRGRFDSVIAWTVNDEAQLLELMALGVNGIITDNPALLRHIVETSNHTPPGREATESAL
jgi:glycerophosphoryl diester phosphodiesterase